MKKIIVSLFLMFSTLCWANSCDSKIDVLPPSHGGSTEKPDAPSDKPGEEPKDEKTISILAIGNSFSVDAMQYLYGFLKEAGYEKIYLGNLYIGGCSLQTHAGHIATNNKAYTYYVTENGTWSNTASYAPLDAIKSRSWDYISMQQASSYSGMPETFDPYLGQIIAAVKVNCPKAKLMWHMTWAYQANSTHSAFPNYGSDQMKMYNAIVGAVKTKILTNKDFSFVIPCGTVIQNLRTSYLGDNITRDGYHMSYNVGRYATAMMWAKQIVGLDIDKSSYLPAGQTLTTEMVAAVKDAVKKAFDAPLEISESAFPPVPVTKPDYKPNEELRKMVAEAGYKLDDYTELEYEIVPYSYFNSSSSSIRVSKETGSTATNIDQYASAGIFEKKDLPRGTILALKSGYAYRPEAWITLATKNSTRPAAVSSPLVVVDDTWWGSWNFRAFNISMQGVEHMSQEQMDAAQSGFAIFVPKVIPDADPTVKEVDDLFTDAGYNLSDYSKLSLTITHNAYYNSSNSTMKSTLICADNSTASNLNQFAGTQIFAKSEIPEGSVLVVKNGYQYRPEAWTALDTVNASSNRPGNVTTSVVKVTSAWWGSWNYRAFNLAKAGNPALSADEQKELDTCFAVYIPVK